jgi:hypothetical protein
MRKNKMKRRRRQERRKTKEETGQQKIQVEEMMENEKIGESVKVEE